MDRRLIWFPPWFAPVLAWSWRNRHDRFTGGLESVPILAGLPPILALGKKFPLSSLRLVLSWFHGAILMVGGHYPYALVPLGEWAKAWFGGTRNNSDKLGHFAPGFAPAIPTRELRLRTSPLKGSRWLGFLVVCICLGFSAFDELIEWATAATPRSAADAFLGPQGDPWDTPTDRPSALVGAAVAVVSFSGLPDRSLLPRFARNEAKPT